MEIGEVSEKHEISSDTLRYYERIRISLYENTVLKREQELLPIED